jgi:hypothetical protein
VTLGDPVLDAPSLGEVGDLGPVLLRTGAGTEGRACGSRTGGRGGGWVGSLAAMHGEEGGRIAMEKGKSNCKQGRKTFGRRGTRTFKNGGRQEWEGGSLGEVGSGPEII